MLPPAPDPPGPVEGCENQELPVDIGGFASKVLELLPVPVVALEAVSDPADLRIVWANPFADDRFGADVVGSWLDRDRPFGPMGSIVAETVDSIRTGRLVVLARTVEQAGSVTHLRCTVLPVGEGAAVAVRDVTADVEARAELAVVGGTLERVERWGNLGVWEVDLRSSSVYWSTQVYEILGVEDQCLESFDRVVHPDDRAIMDHVVRRLLDQPGPYRLTHRIIRNGEVRTLDQHMQSVPDATGRPARLLGTMIDVTATRALQQQVHQGQQMRTIGLLAGGMAHDLANALFVMRGHADVLLARDGLDEAVRESLAAIARGAERASTLTRRFMALGRHDELRPARVDLLAVAEDVVDLVDPTLRSEVAVGVVRAEPDVRPHVLVDADRLRQAVLDLVFNARDAGATSITLRVGEVVLAPDDDRSVDGVPAPGRYGSIDVVDDGAGMDQATIERAFEPFFTTKDVEAGSGLGLANVQAFAVQSLGGISATSTPGDGTTMSILLPAADEGRPARRSRPRARRVLVGAPPARRDALTGALGALDAQLVCMGDLAGVTYSLATEPIDVAVLDESLVSPSAWPEGAAGVPMVVVTSRAGTHPRAAAEVAPDDAAALLAALEVLLSATNA